MKSEIINLLKTKTHNFKGQQVHGINARHLHQALQVGKMFSHWIKNRIRQGGFIEGMDFLIVQNAIIDLPKLASSKDKQLSLTNSFN